MQREHRLSPLAPTGSFEVFDIPLYSILFPLLLLLLRFFRIPRPRLCLAERTNRRIAMNLLMAGQTGLHRRRLLLIPKRRRRIRQRRYSAAAGRRLRRSKAAFAAVEAAKAAKQLRMTASHGEDGIVLQLRQGGGHRTGEDDVCVAELFRRPAGRRREDVREGFVLVKDAGRLEAVLVLVRDVRELVQVQEVRPHAVDVLFERDVVGQQLPRVLLHRYSSMRLGCYRLLPMAEI
jgi:hypothetical protein